MMTPFDKCCAVLAIPIGVVFMVLGAVGVFTGSSAHFTLPPILGGLPFFLGWAISVTLIRFWRNSNAQRPGEDEAMDDFLQPPLSAPDGQSPF